MFSLISSLLTFFIFALLLRIWMQLARVDFYSHAAQLVAKVTQPVVQPFKKVVPSFRSLDTATLLVAYLSCVLKILLVYHFFSFHLFWYGALTLLKLSGTLVFWILLIRAIMSWLSSGRSDVDYILYQLTEPLLAPIRRFVPALGGLDFSAMILFIFLYILNSQAVKIFGTVWIYL